MAKHMITSKLRDKDEAMYEREKEGTLTNNNQRQQHKLPTKASKQALNSVPAPTLTS